MHHTNVVAKGLALLLASTAANANPIALYKELLKREPPRALPQNASPAELKWQPALDFDTDGCYNTPAISASGKVAEGLSHDYTGAADKCHDPSDLRNNNVYVRTRCNHGWCAYLYDYYFEKDVAVEHVDDAGGHRHDWEHIVVFVKDGDVKVVAASQHGDYETRKAKDVRFYKDTHAKIVYHKDGGTTHAFRFGTSDDEHPVENDTGDWFRGDLVSYDGGFPSLEIRKKLMTHDFGEASIAIKSEDNAFKKNLDYARNDLVPGFDSGSDGN